MERALKAAWTMAEMMIDAYPGICIFAVVVLAVFLLIVIYSMVRSGE